MSVKRETVARVLYSGKAVVLGARRQKNGQWSVDVDLDFLVLVDNTRTITVKRTVAVRASVQSGRRAG